MKKSIITILATMLVTTIMVIAIFEIIAQTDQPEADALIEIESKVLSENRELLIHLPLGFNPAKRYPIMYVLDGASQDFRIAGIAEILNRADIVEKFIIVGIPNTNRNRDLTPHYIYQETDGQELGKGDRFLDFLTTEVIPFVESRYLVKNRMLAGHSRAGLYTFYAYLEKPEVFDAIFCFSPAFWRDDMIILEKTQQFYSSIVKYNPYIFMSLGTEENEKMKHAYDSMVKHLSKKNVGNLIHTYTEEANHNNNLFYSSPLALKKWADHIANN